MKILSALVLVALLTGPAAAQTAVPKYGEADKDKTPAEIAADKQTEKDYNRSLNSIPESKSNDPWGTVRSDSNAPPKAATKAAPAKPKSKATDAKATDAKSAATRTDSPASPAK